MFFVDPDISTAKTLDTAFYLDEEFFVAAKQKLFSKSWHYIGDEVQVAKENDCYPLMLLPGFLDEPLVLTRSAHKKVHCLSNVCTHRGNILVNKPCNHPHLRCRYHGRLFHLDGAFRSMPEFKEVKNFPSVADNLTALPIHHWGSMLFASLQSESAPVHFFDEMMHRLDWLPIEQFVLKPDLTQTFSVNAHWALYCENYLEGFHIPFVHAGLNAVIDFNAYTSELFRYANLQIAIARKGEMCFDMPASSADYGKHIAAYYFFVFPNLMFNFYPWGLSLNIVEPVTPVLTRVRFVTYIWKEELYNKGAGSSLGVVEHEDEEVVEAVQLGIRSRFYRHGRYSVTREQGTHHFHRMICEFMNSGAR